MPPTDPLAALERQLSDLQRRLDEESAARRVAEEGLKKATERLQAVEAKLNSRHSLQNLAQISRIYPKSRSVAFVGGGYFGDNIKYAFLSFLPYARANGIGCYFLTEDEAQYALLKSAGLPCRMPFGPHGSPDDFQTLAGTKVIVLNDYFYPQPERPSVAYALLQGAKSIQVWHGIPLKEIGLQAFSSGEIMAACGPFDAFVATNVSSRPDWELRFRFGEFSAVGYPRDDVFFRTTTENDLLNADRASVNAAEKQRAAGTPVILYAPTFRNHEGAGWIEKAGLDAIGAHCKAKGYALYVNLHPLEQHAVEALRQRHPGITFIAPHGDIYPFVKLADVLVTDYSSLAFDFLLADRPLVFYRPDHEDYITKSRPLIPGREHYTTGPTAAAIGDLAAAIDAAVAASRKPDSDIYRPARHKLRDELFDHVDGQAGQRLAELIGKHLEATP